VEKVYDLFERYPGSLIGVATGAQSGFDVLDLDLRSGAGAFWEENRDRLQHTRVQQTRSGGYHVFYEHQEGLRNSVSKLAPGCDVRADDGYVIWWHAAGFPIISDAQPTKWPAEYVAVLMPATPAPAPAPRPWRGDGYDPYAVAALRRAVERIATAREGIRNETLNAECWAMARFIPDQLSLGAVIDALSIAASHAGLPVNEAQRTIGSALRARGVA
jgi:hypothetical protein